LFIALNCLGTSALAQNKELNERGIIFKKNSSTRLPGVLVTNMATKVSVTNDQLGTFEIKCAIGDTLSFSCPGMTDQKEAVTSDVSMFIYMQPNILLMQVDIKDMSKKQELNDVMKGYNKQGIYNNGKTSTLGAVFSPINGLYDLFGSGPKNARHFQKYAAAENEQTEIDRRFTKPLVKKCTGIADSTKLELFMRSYRPQVDDIRKWSDYDLIAYIKKSYQSFEEVGEKPPVLQKLY
jgi:hypothetical protein